MNKNKWIPILLFLLLLLIIICTWCHTGKIAKDRVMSSNAIESTQANAISSKPIDFHLTRDKNSFELKGNFSNHQEVEELHAALGVNELKDSAKIDDSLIQKDDVIALTTTLIPLFYEKYENGAIYYKNGKLVVEGVTGTQADKDAISTLLANSTIPSENKTIVKPSGPSEEELAAIKLAQEEKAKEDVRLKALADEQAKKAEAEKLAAEEMAKKEAIAAEQARLKAIAVEKAEKIEAKIKKIISFEDINFELNKATLTEQSINTVSEIATVLKENPSVNVEIGGHTDSSGDETHNLNLSQARVDSVKNNLINMQISSNRIKAVGYGETKPLVSNDTEENRRINRRVEFKILGE